MKTQTVTGMLGAAFVALYTTTGAPGRAAAGESLLEY
jgi:hypothetical protein